MSKQINTIIKSKPIFTEASALKMTIRTAVRMQIACILTAESVY